MRFSVSVALTHRSVTTAEAVTGTVCISNALPVAVTTVDVAVRGEVMVHHVPSASDGNGRSISAPNDWHRRTTFYEMSPPATCYDEARCASEQTVTELAPGRHVLPFSFTLPADLPVSFRSRSGDEHMMYFVRACVHCACNGSKGGRTDKRSAETPLAVVANSATVTQERTEAQTGTANGVAITCSVNKTAAVGTAVSASIAISNAGAGARDISRVAVRLYGHHEFGNSVVHVVHAEKTLSRIEAGATLERNIDIAVPAEAMPDAVAGDLQWRNFLCVEAFTGAFRKNVQLQVPLPLLAPCAVPASVLTERSKEMKMARNFGQRVAFFGTHHRGPPMYSQSPECPPGWERVQSPSGTVYLDHASRACSDVPGGPSNGVPYPLWESLCLPAGWSRASNDGEQYFVDHVNGATSWEDPRPPGSRAPAAAGIVTPTIDVTVMRGRGLGARGRGRPDPYCSVMSWSATGPKAIKTAAARKSRDPVWSALDGNTLRIRDGVEARNNVVVYLTHKSVTTAEPVTGVVCISCTRPAAVVGPVEVSVRGEAMVHCIVTASGDRFCAAGIDWVDRTTFYTMSPPAHCYDESRCVGAGSVTEYPPGRHLLPFSFTLPGDLPVSMRSRTGQEHLMYFVRARVQFANGKKDAWSEEVPIAVVANNAAVTQEHTLVQSDPNPDGVTITDTAGGPPNGLRYPMWDSANLPDGWTRARTDDGEEYFIDHANGANSHIKTAAKKKTQNPVWTSLDGNTFRLRNDLDTRNNVGVYVWDKNLLWDSYIGSL
eukprot:m51a1_g12386 hypothetical protein (773) ;mRNA; f:639110-643784